MGYGGKIMNLVRWNNQPRFSAYLISYLMIQTIIQHLKALQLANQQQISRKPEGFELDLAIPGLNKDDVKINLEKNVLTISAESSTDNSNYSRREFGYNSFSRSFSLPKSINVEKIVAKHENGILSISLPKK